MESNATKKNGLIYSKDLKTLIGINHESDEFKGIVPYGVENIQDEAFADSDLTYIELPDTVNSIGNAAFYNCKKLLKIHLPLNLHGFSSYLFYGCSSLKEIPFRYGIKALLQGVIAGCSSITSLVIPDSVEKICCGSIKDCFSLKSIVLPADLKVFEQDAVENCPSLSHIRISEDNKTFCTDEKFSVLYKIEQDGTKTAVFEVPLKEKEYIPSFKELGEDENPSIIDYNELQDESDDDAVLFASKEELSSLSDSAEVSENNTNPKIYSDRENELASKKEDKNMNEENNSMNEKLAEILGQNSFGSDDFSIADIPEASEQEIESSKLEQSDGSINEQVKMEQNLQETQESIEQNQPSEEIAAANETENNLQDSQKPFECKNSEEDDNAIMNNIFFESQKVEQKNTGIAADKKRILYVFTQTLCDTKLGKKFSASLINCCNRLAKIHSFTSIYFFYGTRIDTRKFRNQLSMFMMNRDVVYAVSADYLSLLDDNTRDFLDCLGIGYTKESLEQQLKDSKNPNAECLKLLVQDKIK